MYFERTISTLLLLGGLVHSAAAQSDYVILKQVTGPVDTNTYLLYDPATKEAALFDVGGPIDSLITTIETLNLNVAYIFTTHGHVDHLCGVPAAQRRFPEAKWGISRREFEDLDLYARWEETLPPEMVAEMKRQMEQDEEVASMMAFDFSALGEPDVFLEDDQVYRLGALEIHTFLSPGHSRGSICFHVADMLFSGDVLFHRTVGRSDLPGAGGREVIAASIRRLYAALPDGTKVYPGHGRSTDIGSEKAENRRVKMEDGSTPH
jgi:hydroxyacylglutathione hydrolase